MANAAQQAQYMAKGMEYEHRAEVWGKEKAGQARAYEQRAEVYGKEKFHNADVYRQRGMKEARYLGHEFSGGGADGFLYCIPVMRGFPSPHALEMKNVLGRILIVQGLVCFIRLIFLRDILSCFWMAMTISIGAHGYYENMNITYLSCWGSLCLVNGIFDFLNTVLPLMFGLVSFDALPLMCRFTSVLISFLGASFAYHLYLDFTKVTKVQTTDIVTYVPDIFWWMESRVETAEGKGFGYAHQHGYLNNYGNAAPSSLTAAAQPPPGAPPGYGQPATYAAPAAAAGGAAVAQAQQAAAAGYAQAHAQATAAGASAVEAHSTASAVAQQAAVQAAPSVEHAQAAAAAGIAQGQAHAAGAQAQAAAAYGQAAPQGAAAYGQAQAAYSDPAATAAAAGYAAPPAFTTPVYSPPAAVAVPSMYIPPSFNPPAQTAPMANFQ